MRVVEASVVDQCLMNFKPCVNSSVCLKFLIDIGGGYDVIHEHTVRKVGEPFMAPSKNSLE